MSTARCPGNNHKGNRNLRCKQHWSILCNARDRDGVEIGTFFPRSSKISETRSLGQRLKKKRSPSFFQPSPTLGWVKFVPHTIWILYGLVELGCGGLGWDVNNLFRKSGTLRGRDRYFARLCYVGIVDLEYGYGILTGLTEVPGTSYRTHRSFGYGMEVSQNSQKFRVRYTSTRTPGIVARAHRSYRSFGYGYECRTELTEVPGTYGYRCCTEFAEVPGTGNTRVNTRLKGAKNNKLTGETITIYIHIHNACMSYTANGILHNTLTPKATGYAIRLRGSDFHVSI